MIFKFFLFGFAFLILLGNSCALRSNPTNGIYLISEGYTGSVISFFNQPDGIAPEIENDFYVYKIPESGILKVKTSGVTGIGNKSYFYVDKNGARRKIDSLRITGNRNPSGEPQNKFGNITQNEYSSKIFIMSDGGIGSFNTKGTAIQYTGFIVGTPQNNEDLYDKMQERISELQREFIKNS